jgi:L-alanine-DL-glutamate epimerase-like enolase superfamily enzyme
MKMTDIRIVEIETNFTEEKFRVPLALSTGEIKEIIYAEVRIVVQNRLGRPAQGIGSILLSDLWAFPDPELDHAAKDRLMRSMVQEWGERLLAQTDYADPLQHACRMEPVIDDGLDRLRQAFGLNTDIPRLAGLVAFAPLDAALHDGWAKAADRSAYTMYTQEFLNEDLGHYIGPRWKGRFPGDYLRGTPAKALWLQHVVGASDPLTRQEAGAAAPDDGLPVALSDWLRRDRLRWFKLKIKGADLAADLERILQVFRVASEEAARCGIHEPILYEIDPNEGFSHPDMVVELLRKLKERSEEAYAALQYIEQPTPRALSDYSYTLSELAAMKPVLADESLDDLARLPDIANRGFNGAALKTCKGHSHALLTYCWAQELGLHVAVQDLTNPGRSLAHSAGLAAHLRLSWDCLEANSRQYIPFSRPEERNACKELFDIRYGRMNLTGLSGSGIY